MVIGEGESWGIFGWIWVCTDVRDVGTKGSVEEMSPGPIFVIRPLPWQVRLHGRVSPPVCGVCSVCVPSFCAVFFFSLYCLRIRTRIQHINDGISHRQRYYLTAYFH
ncbi:unnamed protein product [Malus baccata var. baccata]